MRVLTVDDDPVAQEALTSTLTEAGYEPIVACDGRGALDVLRQGECRLVISDWMMPGMDGLDLCRQVRREDFGGYVYLILLSAKSGHGDLLEGLTAGADEFLTKPFEPAELLLRVRTGERILSAETRDVAIFAMAKLAESRDPETGEHLERMRYYSSILAEQMVTKPRYCDQVTSDFARLVHLTSPLHDIGKVGIPDCVLLKPGRLSDREFEIMKTHTRIGARTLDAAVHQYPRTSYLRFARDIALTHHERYDGTGYPQGLAGNRIPLCGRVVALADAYDALTSKRVYKEAFAHDVARNEILNERGKHFDPDVVECFLECEDRFLATQARETGVEMVVT